MIATGFGVASADDALHDQCIAESGKVAGGRVGLAEAERIVLTDAVEQDVHRGGRHEVAGSGEQHA